MNEKIIIRLEPRYIHFLDSIMEGYEYFGIVSTLPGEKDMVMIRVTPDTYGEVLKILENLPMPAAIISN